MQRHNLRLNVTDRHSSLLDHYRQCLTIRKFEEKLLALFTAGLLGGTTHTSIGQEVAQTGIMAAMDRQRDCVFSNHRGHGHFLAYCGEMYSLAAEIFGQPDGVCGGRGGSQHLHKGNFYSNGIQGGIVGNATGIALAERQRGEGAVTLVWLGDGTLGEGIVYESMNLASLWKLPIIFSIEANGIAQTTATGLQMAGTIGGRCAAFDIPFIEISGSDVEEALNAGIKAFDTVRAEQRPYCIVSHATRLGPHSKGDDTRDPEFLKAAWARDPLAALRSKSLADSDVDAEVTALIESVFRPLMPAS